ncbi:BT3A1 protein, partial [Polypterus senegalus]
MPTDPRLYDSHWRIRTHADGPPTHLLAAEVFSECCVCKTAITELVLCRLLQVVLSASDRSHLPEECVSQVWTQGYYTVVSMVHHLKNACEEYNHQIIDVDIILDPDTAHPKFIISEDCKRMRRGEEWREVPDNRERFNERRCAVASEGFISGQCYWQVDMGENRGWALGVIKASAERKGNLKMTPALGYWVLWHENNLVKALTEERTELFVTKVPKIVGVYLDYEERQVSFYNAAIRSHIYTYVGMDFDTEEKLFPLFYLWDWRSDLTIFTVSSELQAEVAPIREAIQTDQS